MPFGSPVPPFATRPCLRPVQQMPKVSETEKKLNALCDNAVQLAGQAVYLQYQGDDLTHVVLGGHLINQTPKQLLKMAGHTSQLALVTPPSEFRVADNLISWATGKPFLLSENGGKLKCTSDIKMEAYAQTLMEKHLTTVDKEGEKHLMKNVSAWNKFQKALASSKKLSQDYYNYMKKNVSGTNPDLAKQHVCSAAWKTHQGELHLAKIKRQMKKEQKAKSGISGSKRAKAKRGSVSKSGKKRKSAVGGGVGSDDVPSSHHRPLKPTS